MNRDDLAELVAEKILVTHLDGYRAVEAVLKGIEDALVRGESVNLPNFGTFEVHQRKEKESYNINTGEYYLKSGYVVPFFRGCRRFKNRMNGKNIQND